jgi:methylmalonyl-CoA mutase N-terminal domain/subunit
MTDEIEEEALKYFDEIHQMGGTVEAVEDGYFQKKISESASEFQELVDSKRRIIVGVNEFVEEDEKIDIEILKISHAAEKDQIKKINSIRNSRNNSAVKEKLDLLKKACIENENLVNYIIDVADHGGTLGEIVDLMKSVYGEWEESFSF